MIAKQVFEIAEALLQEISHCNHDNGEQSAVDSLFSIYKALFNWYIFQDTQDCLQ